MVGPVIERRLALKLIAAGVLAAPADASRSGLVSIAPAQAAAAGYQPEFFTSAEMTTLDRLTEIVIPADDHSPGASAAKVNRYIDVMVADGADSGRRAWRAGLANVDAEARRRFGSAFVELSAGQQDAVVAGMAANEDDPRSDLDRFFRLLKRMTVDGFYTSEVGVLQDLQYQGNTAISEFQGCTHPEHQG